MYENIPKKKNVLMETSHIQKEMYKVVVSDLDGTLLNSDQEVSELSKKVIRELHNRGIKFYIATGRAYPDAKRIMESIGIKIPLISANGGVINDVDGKVNPFKEEPHFTSEIKPIEELRKRNITKIYYIGPRKELLKLEKIILEKTEGKVNVAFTHPECLEIFDMNVNKAIAVKTLCDIEGFTLDDVIAFGDGFNDYEMLKEAKKGCIMKNAHYTLKEALPNLEIVTSNSRNGVAKKLMEVYGIEIDEE